MDHVVQIHRRLLPGSLTREGEQVPHDPSRAIRLLVNHAQVPPILRAELLLLEQELGQPRDRRQGVVELVRHTGDELAHRGELLALDQLRLQRLLIRHVLD
ncbi:MAG: hypothetical protein DMD56_03130 [Gemmatimonadetes bacterium]|nr:MAG: hypothetical protein DMD56_03130 [Gemmatimonadota bacterium]